MANKVVNIGSFKDEPIRWVVANINKKDSIYNLISEKVLCTKEFDSPKSSYENKERVKCGSNNWENSDLRVWLNNKFLNDAFSDAERHMVVNVCRPTVVSKFDILDNVKGNFFYSDDGDTENVLINIKRHNSAFNALIYDRVTIPSRAELFNYSCDCNAYPTIYLTRHNPALPPKLPAKYWSRSCCGNSAVNVYFGTFGYATASDDGIGVRPMISISVEDLQKYL